MGRDGGGLPSTLVLDPPDLWPNLSADEFFHHPFLDASAAVKKCESPEGPRTPVPSFSPWASSSPTPGGWGVPVPQYCSSL